MSTTSSQTIQVLLPELGESVTEGIVVEWRVAEGDVVETGQPLLDVTTDKVDVEVPAPAAGRVAAHRRRTGRDRRGRRAPRRDGLGRRRRERRRRPASPAEASADGGDGAAAADEGPARWCPIVLPDMESVTEGVVVEWRVAVGDAVAADQIVVEVSTDKVDLEVPAPAAGRLASIAVPAGETFTVGSPLGEIAAGAGPAAGDPRARPPAARRPRRPPPARRPPPDRVAADQPRRTSPRDRARRRSLGHHRQRRRAA